LINFSLSYFSKLPLSAAGEERDVEHSDDRVSRPRDNSIVIHQPIPKQALSDNPKVNFMLTNKIVTALALWATKFNLTLLSITLALPY